MQSWNPWSNAAANYAAQQQALGFPAATFQSANVVSQPAAFNIPAPLQPQMSSQQWNMLNPQQQQWQQQQWQQWQQQYQQWHMQYGDKYQEAMKTSAAVPGAPVAGNVAGINLPQPPLPDDQPAPPLPPDDMENPPLPPVSNWSQSNNNRGGGGRGGTRGGGNRGGSNIENNFQSSNQFSLHQNINVPPPKMSFQGGQNQGFDKQNSNQNFQIPNKNQGDKFSGFQTNKHSLESEDTFSRDQKRSRRNSFDNEDMKNLKKGDRGLGRGALGNRGGTRGGHGRGNNSNSNFEMESYDREDSQMNVEDSDPFVYTQAYGSQQYSDKKFTDNQYQNENFGAQQNQEKMMHQGYLTFQQKSGRGREDAEGDNIIQGNQQGYNIKQPFQQSAIEMEKLSERSDSWTQPQDSRKDDKDDLSEAEKAFDGQFQAWEEQFNKWKEQNKNHPDKNQYREYEAQWESWREQLLSRRESMRKKREAASDQQIKSTQQSEKFVSQAPASKQPDNLFVRPDGPSGQKQPSRWQQSENQELQNVQFQKAASAAHKANPTSSDNKTDQSKTQDKNEPGLRRSFGESKVNKLDAPQIKSIEETLKTLFPDNLTKKQSPNDPMLITLEEEDSSFTSGPTSTTGGIPGLDLVIAGVQDNEKLPENRPPSTVIESHKTITTPATDKPFVDPKAQVNASKTKENQKDVGYPWHTDNFFNDSPMRNDQFRVGGPLDVNSDADDAYYRRRDGNDGWPQRQLDAGSGPNYMRAPDSQMRRLAGLLDTPQHPPEQGKQGPQLDAGSGPNYMRAPDNQMRRVAGLLDTPQHPPEQGKQGPQLDAGSGPNYMRAPDNQMRRLAGLLDTPQHPSEQGKQGPQLDAGSGPNYMRAPDNQMRRVAGLLDTPQHPTEQGKQGPQLDAGSGPNYMRAPDNQMRRVAGLLDTPQHPPEQGKQDDHFKGSNFDAARDYPSETCSLHTDPNPYLDPDYSDEEEDYTANVPDFNNQMVGFGSQHEDMEKFEEYPSHVGMKPQGGNVAYDTPGAQFHNRGGVSNAGRGRGKNLGPANDFSPVDMYQTDTDKGAKFQRGRAGQNNKGRDVRGRNVQTQRGGGTCSQSKESSDYAADASYEDKFYASFPEEYPSEDPYYNERDMLPKYPQGGRGGRGVQSVRGSGRGDFQTSRTAVQSGRGLDREDFQTSPSEFPAVRGGHQSRGRGKGRGRGGINFPGDNVKPMLDKQDYLQADMPPGNQKFPVSNKNLPPGRNEFQDENRGMQPEDENFEDYPPQEFHEKRLLPPSGRGFPAGPATRGMPLGMRRDNFPGPERGPIGKGGIVAEKDNTSGWNPPLEKPGTGEVEESWHKVGSAIPKRYPEKDAENVSQDRFPARRSVESESFSAVSGPRSGRWGAEESHRFVENDMSAFRRPKSAVAWDELEEFKPASVVDYGHQTKNVTAAANLPASLTIPNLIVPTASRDSFPEPLQTFDYGHGKATGTTRNSERDSDAYNSDLWNKPVRQDRWEDERRRAWERQRDDRYRNSWSERGRERNYAYGDDENSNDGRFRDATPYPQRGFSEEKEDFKDKGKKEQNKAPHTFAAKNSPREVPGPKQKLPQKTPSSKSKPPPDVPPPPSLEPCSESILVEDLLCLPGRVARPSRIALFMRGPPGSGKSFVAKLIKDKELANGGHAPRILCLDDYYMTEKEKDVTDPDTGRTYRKKEMFYEYEPEMESHYRNSLCRGFKKTVDDGFFPFIILDCVNDKLSHFEEMWNYAKQKGFQNYVAEMEMDAGTCAKRNEHNRTLNDIEELMKNWEPSRNTFTKVDLRSLLQSASINEVEMEDLSDDEFVPIDETGAEQSAEDSGDGIVDLPSSKWESIEASEEKLDRLDGLTKRRPRETQTLEDWLQLSDDYDTKPAEPGKKRVTWADLRERKEQERMRAIGFVVGQTDWSRMTDPTFGQGALTQTKYI